MSLDDQTIEHFGQFMQSLALESRRTNSLENRCAICLDLLFNPHLLDPCQHIFCEPCLRRLSGARITKCPMCRARIRRCVYQKGECEEQKKYQNLWLKAFFSLSFPSELADSIRLNNPADFQRRHISEIGQNSGNFPLPPVWRTPREILQEWQDSVVIPEEFILIFILMLTIFMQVCIITLMHVIFHTQQRLPISVLRLIIEIAICFLRMFRLWPSAPDPDE